jgi:TRAP-type C4-dicarboxylate transport system substrate-binding protein
MPLLRTLALAATTFAVVHTSAFAQQNWKIASAAQPGSALIGYVDETARKIGENTKGEIKAERLFVGSEQEIVQQVVRGRIEMGSVSTAGTSPLIPELAVLNTPYLWRSNAERDFVTDNHVVPLLSKLYEAKGLVFIGMGEVGWNDVVCKKPCLTPASVKGMKVRISPTPASKTFWNSLQANGVQMPLSELFPALQSGLVDGADLPFSYYVTTPAAQSTPHYVLTRHLHHPSAFFVNKRVWDALTPAQREQVAAARPAVDRMRREVEAEEKPKMEEFKKKGGFIHELTPEQRAEWSKLVEPNQLAMIKEIGGQAQEVWDAVQAGKKAFAARGGK